MAKELTDEQLKDYVLGVAKDHDVVFADKLEEKIDKKIENFKEMTNKEKQEAVDKAYQKGLVKGATSPDSSDERKKGELFADAMRWAYKSAFNNDKVDLQWIAEKSADKNPALSAVTKNFIEKAQLQDPDSAGGHMVPEDLSRDFIDYLRPQSVLSDMGTRRVEVQSGERLWNFAETGTSAGWGGELDAADPSKMEIDRRDITTEQLQVLNVQSRRVLRRSREDFQQIIMEDMRDAARYELEDQFVNGDGADNHPYGILAQKDPDQEKTSVADGSSIQDVLRELISLVYMLENKNQRVEQGGFLMTPRDYYYLLSAQDSGIFMLSQIAQGELFGHNVGVTNVLPEDLDVGGTPEGTRILFADFRQIIEGYSLDLEMRVADRGTVPSVGEGDINLFTQDARALLLLQEAGILVRRPSSVATLEDATFSSELKRD